MGGRQRRVGIKVDADTRDFNAGMASATRSVRGFVLEMGAASNALFSRTNLMQAGIAGAAVATVSALKATVGAAAAFETQMRNVNSIVKASESEFARMSSSVLALSEGLPQSAETLAAGLYDIASSGFQGAEGITVLEASARAATAGMTDTATAAKGITAVLNAYGLEASDAARVSDVLFQTVNLGVITFEELASELGDVVGIAAAAGIEYDELGSAIATMTLTGVSAAESTTSLNRVIQSLLDPSEALAAVWKSVSDESIATTLAQEGLHAVMSKLQGVVGANVEVLLALFPEIRAARGVFALLANDAETYRKVQEGITDEQKVASATQRAFNEQMKATGNQIRLVGQEARSWGIEMGARALPAVQGLVGGLAGLGQVLASTIGFLIEHREIILAIAVIYATRFTARVLEQIALGIYDLAGAAHRAGGALQLFRTGLALAARAGTALVAAGLVDWFADLNGAISETGQRLKEMDVAATPKEEADIIREAEREYERLEKRLEELNKSRNFLGDIWEGLPFTENPVAEIKGQMDDLQESMDEFGEGTKNFKLNAMQIADALGVEFSPELGKQLQDIATALNLDLSDAGSQSSAAREAVIDEFTRMGNEMGLTRKELAALEQDGVEAIAKIQEAAEEARDAFLETFGLLADFEIPNAEDAAKDVEEATERVRDAEEKLADARERAADAGAFINPDPKQQREAADARRDVADAERELAEAREEARKAAELQQDPEKAIEEQYRKQIESAEQFINDLGTVAERAKDQGLDINEFLEKAQLNPEEYAPILRAIAADTDGSLLQTIAASEKRLQELGDRFSAQFSIIKVAVENGMMEINDTILSYLERALSDPEGEIALLAFKLGATIKENVKDGVESTSPTATGGGSADLVLVNRRAYGGIDAHVATHPSVLYGERSTGGEAFIPLGLQHRGRSRALVAEVARMFGDHYVTMDRGGFLGRTAHYNPGGDTRALRELIEVLTTRGLGNSNKNQWNFHGDIRPNDWSGFMAEIDRKSRVGALVGD